MKNRIFPIYLICISLFAMSLPVNAAETLEQAWSIALQRDHQLFAAQQKELAAQSMTGAARANYLPKLTLESGYLRTETEPAAKISIPALPMLKGASLPFAQDAAYFGGVTISAPLITSGKIASGVAAAEALSEAAAAQTTLTRSEQKLAVASSYIAVLRAEHAVAVAQSHIDAVSKHVSDVQQLATQGYVARHDLLASEVALANARQLGLQANNALELARAAYNRWLGRSFEQQVALADLALSADSQTETALATLLQTASTERRELHALDRQSEAYRQQASGIRSGQLPQLGISAGYNKLENRYLAADKGWWVGLVMKWEIFDGGLIRHQASQLSANAQAIRELEQDAREKIALQVRQSWLNRQETKARLQLVAKAVEQADEVLLLARERYREGLAPNSDVLDAETRRLQAYSNRDNAIYDNELARLQLLHVTGQL